MAAKKTAKKAPAKKAPAKKAPVKKEIDSEILGKARVMVKRGRSKEAVDLLVKDAGIKENEASKVVFKMQHG